MNKILRLSIIVLTTLIALLVAAVVLLPSLINTDAFKQTLITQVQERTGQTLNIEGDLSLSVFPWLGIKTDKITLSQDLELSEKPLLEMDGANIGVKLLPLFRQKIEIGQIELKQPKLYYLIAKNGKTSLDSFTYHQTEKNDKTIQDQNKIDTEKSVIKDTKNEANYLDRIAIAGITINDGHIIYNDQTSNTRHEINKLNISTGNLFSTILSPLSLSADIILSSDAVSELQIELKANTHFDTMNGQFSANTINVVVVETTQQQTLNIDAESLLFDSKKQNIKTKSFILKVNAKDLQPVVSIPFIDINLENHSTVPINFSIAEEKSNIKIKGDISLNDWDENLMLKGQINSEAINPSNLMTLFNIDYEAKDKNALQSLLINTRFSAGSNGVSLHDVKINLDDSKLTGDASVINYNKPQYRFDLSLDNINLDRYLPKPDDNDSSIEANAGLAIAAPIPLFKGLKANGVFRANTVQANGAKLQSLRIDIASENKKVVIKPKAKLYKGETNGTITFTENSDHSTLVISNSLKNIDIEPLLVDTDISDQLSGVATSDIKLNITDKNKKQTNKGTITLAIKNGALKGVDIKKILDKTQNSFDRLRGKTNGEGNTERSTEEGTGESTEGSASKEDETRFAEMTATLNLNNNLITNKDLSIKAPAFRVKGKGEIQLETEKLDYLTNIAIVNTNSGQGGLEREELKGAVIPIRFYGKIAEPKYKVDMRALIKENTKQEVNKKKEELKKKALEKLGLKESENNTEDKKDQSSEEQLKDELKKKLLNELFK